MNLAALNNAVDKKAAVKPESNTFMELELSKIFPNPDQPRKRFPLAELMELANSIKQDGLLQPIVVSKREDGFMIIAGERRYKAHIYNKMTTIKVVIVEADEHKISELSLVENIQRLDLTDMEIALHVDSLWNTGKYRDKGGLAKAIGKSLVYVSKALSVTKLDETIVKDVQDTKSSIGLSVLNELATIPDTEVQKDAYDKYRTGEITRDGIATIKKNLKEPDAEEIEYERVDIDSSGKRRILKDKGVPITINGDKDTDFIVFALMEEDGSYSIVEQNSGVALSNAKTKASALKQAKELIKTRGVRNTKAELQISLEEKETIRKATAPEDEIPEAEPEVIEEVTPASKLKKVIRITNGKASENVIPFLSALPKDKNYKITIEEL